MNRTEITGFLRYLSAHDPYVVVDPISVQAWQDALSDDITADFARRFVARHYGNADAPRLTAGSVNVAWRAPMRDKSLDELLESKREAVPMPSWFREQFLQQSQVDA